MTSNADINWRRSFTATKVSRPRLQKILKRQDCLHALNKAAGHKIVYISGRAGQGKTTLALSWLKETKTKAVWITLDTGDNDPSTFFRLFAEAFSIAFPGIKFGLPQIPTGAPFDPSIFARTYWHSLLAQAQGRYAIVLDDFQTLDETGSLPAIVEVLIEALPPKVQLVLLSRQLPSPFFAKWIAARQLFSVTEEVLRFSAKEVEAFFSTILERGITSSQAESLQVMMEGWVTGLILLHEGSKSAPEGIGLKPLFQIDSRDRIFDYLYQEVYRRLDPALQATMMRLALVESFSVESARRFISGSDIAVQIRLLLGHHLLCQTPAGEEIRFRYHPLLRQFLKNQVRSLPERERHPLIDQVGAAQEAEGAVDQAIDLYLENGHFDQAIRLIEGIGLAYTLEGKRHLLRQWIRSLPPERLAYRPWLQYFLGCDQALLNPLEALELYRLAIAGFERSRDIEGELWARSSRMRLALYAGTDFRPVQTDAAWGKQVLRKSGGSLLARASFLLADAFTGLAATDSPQHALRKALAAADAAHEAKSSPLAARALIRAGFAAGYLGKHRMATSMFNQSEAIFPWTQLDPPLRAEALIYRGIVETYCGDKLLSRQHLLEAQQICLEFGLKSSLPLLRSYLIWSRATLGERGESDPSLEPVWKELIASRSFYYAAAISHSRAMLSLEAGNFAEALKHQEETLHVLKRCHTRFLILVPIALLGAIWGEMGEWAKAERYLRRALAGFERAGSDMFRFMALFHLAKLSLDRGDDEGTKNYLTQALRCGKDEQYLVGEGIRPKTMARLLSRARQWEIEPLYVEKLIDFWQVRPEPPLKIQTLGRFSVSIDGEPIPEEVWRRRKAKLLFIALISLGGREASKEAIMDLLWPEADGDRAVTSFHTTLHRLQSVLGGTDKERGFIRLFQGRLSLNPACCWSDCDAFEEAVRRARQAERVARWREAQSYLQEARALYQGDYIPEFSEEPWIAGRRQKLRAQYHWVVERMKLPIG